MGNAIDMVGQVFGRLTVLERDGSTPGGMARWRCQCSCEDQTILTITGSQLRSGKTKSCGCLKKEATSQRSLKDLTGQIFGKLTVIERDPNFPRGCTVHWLCRCTCGNVVSVKGSNLTTHNTSSCGRCNLVGQVFGRLTVLEEAVNYSQEHNLSTHNRYWKCQCICGNIHYTTTAALHGGTQSCGCLNIEKSTKDLSGQRFGKLIAEKPLEERRDSNVVWLCKCDCGGSKKAASDDLLKGKTRSCGCLGSVGEYIIQAILDNANIPYEKEKTFSDFQYDNGQYPRYDFYLPEHNRLIEFDGEQHYLATGGWNTAEYLDLTRQRDRIKNEYALEHNIPLVRIPYWKKDEITLEMLLGDKYLVYKKS